MNKLHLFFFVITLISARCEDADSKVEPSEEAKAYCGARLAKLMSTVCMGEYVRPSKKSSHSPYIGLLDETLMPQSMLENYEAHNCKALKMLEQFNNDNEDLFRAYTLKSLQEASEFSRFSTSGAGVANMLPYYRERRSIVAECCRKPCTLRHIQIHYCGKPF